VKIRQQCLDGPSRSYQIAREIFQQEGFGAFYKGLSAQLLKTSLKCWRWPMISELPPYFQRLGLKDLEQQALTGLSISTVDTIILTPLERAKAISALTGKTQFSFKNGWKGGSAYWLKLSVHWISFLTAQKYFRERERKAPNEPLSLFQLTKVGMQSALFVSVVLAPFDVEATRKLTSTIYSRKVTTLWRGSPLIALSEIIHSIASIAVIELLTSHDIQKTSYG